MDDKQETGSPARQWADHFASLHKVTLRRETPLPEGVPAYKYESASKTFVVMDSSLPQERLNFALAHEVAHTLLGHTDELAVAEEAEANRLAAELLLPAADFASHAWQGLRELKDLFPHASFEALARRRLTFVPGVLTIVDNGQLIRRLTSDYFQAPPRPTPLEWEIIEQALRDYADVIHERDELKIEATYVDDGRGVARVLLFVEQT